LIIWLHGSWVGSYEDKDHLISLRNTLIECTTKSKDLLKIPLRLYKILVQENNAHCSIHYNVINGQKGMESENHEQKHHIV